MKRTRREFLQLSAIGLAGAAFAACKPAAPTAAPSQPKEAEPAEPAEPAGPTFQGKVEMWVQTYTPSEDPVKSEDNPQPRTESKKIAERYMELHPGVEVVVVDKPAGVADHEWIVTQQAGGTIPHIVWSHSFWIQDELGKGWWIALDPFMAEPNPYVADGQPGSDRWLDLFYEIPTEAKRAPDGKLYVMPLDLVTTFFFYNADFFQEMGIEPPETWGDWIEIQQAILDDGRMYPSAHLVWYQSQIGAMLYGKKDPIINPEGGVVTLEMICCAIKEGLYLGSNPEYQEWLRFVRQLVDYLAPDWAATGIDRNLKWLNRDVAVLEDGSWRFGITRANPLVDFEWGSFYSPTIMETDSPFAVGKLAPPIGGATAAQWAVTTRAEKEGVLDATIDVLRFFSAPQNAGPMIDEIANFLPNIKGVPVNPDLVEPLRAVTEGLGEAGMITYPDKIGTEYRERLDFIWADWKLDTISIEEATRQIDDLFVQYADDYIDQFGWEC
jgi:ABC-type glycerol-3-phosphate transport system substrate-binding protein